MRDKNENENLALNELPIFFEGSKISNVIKETNFAKKILQFLINKVTILIVTFKASPFENYHHP
jgi:hypothetical protein